MATMPKVKKTYLAGPMTGIPEYNKPEFDSAADWLRAEHLYSVFSPAEADLDAGFDCTGTTGTETKAELKELGFDLRQALAEDLNYIAREADEVHVLPGFENSKGVAAELALATALGLPVWYLRKNPDGSWYRKDTATGIGQRKIDGQVYQTVDNIDKSAIEKGLLKPEYHKGFVAQMNEDDIAVAEALSKPIRAEVKKFASGGYVKHVTPGVGVDHLRTAQARDAGVLRPHEVVLQKPSIDEGSYWKKLVSGEGLSKESLGSATLPAPTAYKNGEVRLTSASGGQKGSKPERYDLIPVEPLKLLAQLYGFGASKYDDNNWQKGYDWKLSYAACQRHLNAFWGGEDNDPESGLPHLASAAWHCFTLMWFMQNKPEYDSRSKA